jgi:hypothetical protein
MISVLFLSAAITLGQETQPQQAETLQQQTVSVPLPAVLTVMTFCSFMREFSPLHACAPLPPTTRQVARLPDA